MNEYNAIAKSLFEDLNKLASEGDFGDEENSGLIFLDSIRGELKIDIGFATTSNSAEKASRSGTF